MIKDIIKNLKSSSTLKINEISNKLESEGKKIYKFGFGQSPFQVPIDVIDELKNNAYQNKYLPMQGLNELRNAISKYASSQNNQNYKLTEELIIKIKKQIRTNASPRHVPAKIITITDIPRTKNGKIVELAVKNIIDGNEINNREALLNPEVLEQFKNLKELNY